MYTCKSRYLTRAEVWYNDQPGDARSVDWIFYQQRSSPFPGPSWKYFHTYAIDLTQSAEQLLKRLNEDTAYKIRRGRDRDKIVCEECDAGDPAVLNQFEEMYNQFAAVKGLSPLDRARMNAMAAAGSLDLSVAKDPQGNVLVYHANYRDHERATELHLPSLYRKASESATRNLIGRANRYLTWSDMLRYKEQGLKSFDFGGWYVGTTDQALLRINEFKRGFGGQVVREYEGEQILSLKGWVVLNVAKLLKRIKLFPSGSRSAPPPVEGQDPLAAPSA
jgi:hypothetical protein